MSGTESAIAMSLIETIVQRLREGKRVRRRLPHDGWLSIDRPLPMLCVYRRPPDRRDEGTWRLVVGEGSYVIADGDAAGQANLGELLGAVAETLSDHFRAVLIMELWSGRSVAHDFLDGALIARPRFRIVMPQLDAARATVATLARSLRRIRLLGYGTAVTVTKGERATPPHMPPLLTSALAKRLSVVTLGVEVPPVYQDPVSGDLFPDVLHRLHRELAGSLQQASFRFAHQQTSHRPRHYLKLSSRTMLRVVWEVDEQLAQVADDYNLLLAVTPVNTDAAQAEFLADAARREPTFHYRLLNFDAGLLKRRLYAISLERVLDPAMAELFRKQRDELDRQITLLHDRNSSRFLHGSIQLYGGVEDDLLHTAQQILQTQGPTRTPGDGSGEAGVGAQTFARRAREEIAYYRERWPDVTAQVTVRDDVPGLLVTRGHLLVGQSLRLDPARVEALVHHEIGTHVLTYYNAAAQPLKLLRVGLPGYDALQEGTAVLAEYLTGGLTAPRLRLLAGRVLAVRRLIEGRAFAEVFDELTGEHGFSPAHAFSLTMRVFRGGGFTKDAVYLRGLIHLLDYCSGDGDLDLLFLGKVSESALPLLSELRWRDVLRAPPLRPRYLDLPGAAQRLARLRRGMNVVDLIAPSKDPS